MPLGRKLVVEFVGTFFLGYTVCVAVSTAVLIRGRVLASEWLPYVIVANLLGAAAAAVAFLFTQPAEKPEGDVEAART